MRRILLLLLPLLALAASPAAADLRAGLDAFARGDHAGALRELQPLAQKGDPKAQFMLGVMHETGAGLRQDAAAAAQWYRRAAEQGEPSAQFNLGLYNELGRAGPVDLAAAAAWYGRAAAQGHGPAMNNLGSLYYLGKGVPRDLVEAYMWKTLAAEALKDERRTAALGDRDEIAREMTAAQRDAAMRRAAEWRPTR